MSAASPICGHLSASHGFFPLTDSPRLIFENDKLQHSAYCYLGTSVMTCGRRTLLCTYHMALNFQAVQTRSVRLLFIYAAAFGRASAICIRGYALSGLLIIIKQFSMCEIRSFHFMPSCLLQILYPELHFPYDVTNNSVQYSF